MADTGCTSSLCAVERRVIKKELLSWTKKVPVLVGLEVLAEAIVGREVLRQLVESASGADQREVRTEDWNASQSCRLCLINASEQRNTLDHGPWTPEVGIEMLNPAHLFASFPGYCDATVDFPLDLRRHPPNDERSTEVDSCGKPMVELKVPRVVQKACKYTTHASCSLKKNYTEQELDAATSDICSGKIGTRRASALYGIPRSTLRNKVFRLKSDVTTSDENREDSPPHKGIFQLDTFQGVDEIKTEFPVAVPCDRSMDALQDAGAALGNYDGPYKMAMTPSASVTSVPSYFIERQKELSGYACTDPVMEPKLPFLRRLIQEFTDKQINTEIEEQRRYFGVDFGYKSSKPSGRFFLDEGSGSELKIPYYRPLRSTNKARDSCCQSPMYANELSGSELLTSMSRSNRINSVLKDVITKTISEKFRTHRNSRNSGGIFFSSLSFSSSNNNSEAFSSDGSLCSEPVAKHPRSHLLASLQMAASTSSSPDIEMSLADSRSTSGSSDGEKKPSKGEKNMAKKTRPKRGQYRKYNRQLLLEAVKAVQKGDMSVHRAGSYYGVPHSTLEYKVKERHLLRQKKTNTESSKSSSDSTPAGLENEEVPTPSAGSSNTSTKITKLGKPPMLYCKESLEETQRRTARAPSIPPYCYRYPHEDGLLSAAAAASSIPSASAPPSLPLPVGCFRGTLPVGFGWPPLMAGMLPLSSVPGPLFDTQVPNFGFSMSASDLLKRLQQKVQANLNSHGMPREPSVLGPSGDDRIAALSPDMNSGRSSTCSIGSPQAMVS